ncbi:MAG: hypothetical protein V1900_01035 [Candidatus Aenigmatarchaeota archaeon]
MKKRYILYAVLLIFLSSLAFAQENQTNLCANPCSPATLTCPDSYVASCTPSCDPVSGCGTCNPDCSGHQNLCAGVTCNAVTLTCPDGFAASCNPGCELATGTCIVCSPDCSAHQSTNKCTAPCNAITSTCPDGFIPPSCTPTCDPATGLCGTCSPDCTGHQITQEVCAQVITYGVDDAGHCKTFANSCLPPGFKRVDSCPVIGAQCRNGICEVGESCDNCHDDCGPCSTTTNTCPVYNEPECKNGYTVMSGKDNRGCSMPSTCCGDGICNGKENQQNCDKDCIGSVFNCNSVVVCLSGDGCCPPGCSNQDKDCGPVMQCPSGQNCPDGTFVSCYTRDNFCKCDPCPISTTSVPQNCRQEVDSYSGFVRMVCNKICPVDQEKINEDMRYAKEKCMNNDGNIFEKIDERGCKYIECNFGSTAISTTSASINPIYCPSPQQVEDTAEKCRSTGVEPLYTFDKGCKIVKCEERREQGCGLVPGPERERIENECADTGLNVIKEFDQNGCQMIRCGETNDCQREVPKEAFEKCKNNGGELVVKRDYNGCVSLSDCIMRGDERDVYVESIEEMPDATELLGIAFKLEGLKIELDKLAKQTDDIAKYYESTGSNENERFKRVSSMFDAAKQKVDEIKKKLSEKLKTLTLDDIMQVKHDIRYIKDVTLKDIVYVMLSSSDEIKEIVSKSEGDCGSDDHCFDKAFRVCKPVKFTPTKGPNGEPSEGEPDIVIVGLEGDNCIVKITMPTEQGPPAGFVPGVNPPYEMKCKFSDYAVGAMMLDKDKLKEKCEGNLVKLMDIGPGGTGEQLPSQKPMTPTEQQQPIQTTPTSSSSGGGSAGGKGPCAGCLNNGICDSGECSDCPDCYGK